MANKTETLCWKCSKGADECCFMQRLEPVPNWKAKKVMCEGSLTYHVISCPNFNQVIDTTLVVRKRTKVRCIETGRVYISISQCASDLNISSGNLSNRLRCGRAISIGGLHYERVD